MKDSLMQGREQPHICLPFCQEEIEKTIPERFARIVEQFPEQLALRFGEKALTYRELDKASNWVAQAILTSQGEGVAPVGLLFDQGISPIVAILGVIKAGKFYVALNPSFLHSRLRGILQDIRPTLFITDQKYMTLAAELSHKASYVLNINDLGDHVSEDQVRVALSSDTFAAICYTSGSTGQPKGILRSHRVLLHFAYGEANAYQMCGLDRRCFIHSTDVGAAMSSIFGTLLNGATLYPYNIREKGLSCLTKWLFQEKITVFHPPIPLFRQFLKSLSGQEGFPTLRLIIVGGQTLYPQDVKRFQKLFSADCVLLYRLAATEAGVLTHFFIDREQQVTEDMIPVGYASDGKELLLLDKTGKNVDVDHIGEIAVRSYYLSPGYWNDPARTRQKFLPDPEGGDKRIYLTGDLGRMRPDGCLEYLGRKDFQVKIRGYRVVLTEIETALYHLEAVKEAVVVACQHDSGEAGLIAYIVPTQHPAPSVSELRRELAKVLPEYMVPARFVFLDSLPQTSTGKVDRQALPEPKRTRPVLATPFVPPAREQQQQVARIWKEVLELDRVGLYDNFFELGGHSLHATRIVFRLQQDLHIDMPLQTFFELPTIAELAAFITSL